VKLVYWPGAPGRGEYIRFILEEHQIPYEDTGLVGADAVLEMIRHSGEGLNIKPLAPPILVDGDLILSQTSAIAMYLVDKHGLFTSPSQKAHIHQLILTIQDLGFYEMIDLIFSHSCGDT